MSEERGLTDDERRWAEMAAADEQAEAAYQSLLERPARYRCQGCGDWLDATEVDQGSHGRMGDDGQPSLCGPVDAFDLPTRPEGFVVNDDGAADFCLRKIGETEARMRRDYATFMAESERWETWFEQRKAKYQATNDRMQSLLSAYYQRLKEDGILGKSKNYKLPHGVLQARAHPVKWSRNEPLLLEWARGAGLVRTKEEPAWSEIVKRLVPDAAEIGAGAVDTMTGELVPGVQVLELAKDAFQAKADLD